MIPVLSCSGATGYHRIPDLPPLALLPTARHTAGRDVWNAHQLPPSHRLPASAASFLHQCGWTAHPSAQPVAQGQCNPGDRFAIPCPLSSSSSSLNKVRFARCDDRSSMIAHGSTMIIQRLSRSMIHCFFNRAVLPRASDSTVLNEHRWCQIVLNIITVLNDYLTEVSVSSWLTCFPRKGWDCSWITSIRKSNCSTERRKKFGKFLVVLTLVVWNQILK